LRSFPMIGQAIQSLCGSGRSSLAGGRRAAARAPEQVMDYYSAIVAEKEQQTVSAGTSAGGAKRALFSGTGESSFDRI